MSDTLRRYNRGETVTSMDWTADDETINDAWILHDDLRREKAVGQIGLFDKEVYYTKLNPVIELTAEQEHLLRPTETKGTSHQVLPLQFAEDARKLVAVRSELASIIDGTRGLEADPQSLNAGGRLD